MMKVTRLIFGILAAVTLPLLSCTREIVEVTPPQESEGQSLHVSIGSDFTTKSALTNTGASQHIEHMYAYLFREDTPGDGNFKCFYAVDMDWTPVEGTGISDFSYRISRDAGLQAMGDRLIKVLVVAVDNNRGNYRFPVSADGQKRDTGSHVSMQELEGMPFDDVKAVLADDVAGVNSTADTHEAKAWAMAHTELFSGVAGPVPANTPVIEVTVDRCVAGILCYLTDIPLMVESGEDARIRSIELRLKKGLDLNTEVTLEGQSEGSAPLHGGALQEEVVIASADVSMYSEAQGDSGAEEGMLYIPATDDGTVKTLENSILFGAYLVPVRIPEDEDSQEQTDATLNIVLRGGENMDKVSTFYIRNEPGTQTSPSGEADIRKYSYSLLSNHMYAIGTKPTSGDTEGDRPASLAGDELLLNVVDWVDDINPDVQFPSYSLGAFFNAEFDSDDILDCIGDTLDVSVMPAPDGAPWIMNVLVTDPETGEPDIPDWLLYRIAHVDEATGDISYKDDDWRSGTFVFEDHKDEYNISSSEEVKMQVVIADHAVQNYIMGESIDIAEKIKKLEADYRTARFVLNTGSGRSEELLLNQYNAITVQVGDDKDPEYRAFARNDASPTKLDFDNGYYDEGRISYTGWGFSNSSAPVIFGTGTGLDDDGVDNCWRAYNEYVIRENDDINNYYGSALFRGTKWCIAISEDESAESGYKLQSKINEEIWGTPAYYEILSFFQKVVLPIANSGVYELPSISFGPTSEDELSDTDYPKIILPVINVKYGRYYWSSTPYLVKYAYAFYIIDEDIDGLVEIPDTYDDNIFEKYARMKSGNRGYVRPMRKFQ